MKKLAGDARCCSPGHTVKFGLYSMMDLHTGKLLDIKLVQVSIKGKKAGKIHTCSITNLKVLGAWDFLDTHQTKFTLV